MSHERTPVTIASPDDLDGAALEAFIAARAPAYLATLGPEELAVRLGLLARMGSKLHPTPVGLCAFGRAPQLYHPEWGVSVVRVAGGELTDELVDKRDLEGNLPSLVAATLSFVAERAPDEHPTEAVREALVNALVHRDLRKTARVALRIFDDRLEVQSPGGLPEGLGDLEDAIETGGVSLPRNPLLAATARALGLSEQLGRGLPLLRRAATVAGATRALVSTSATSVLVVLPSRRRRSTTMALS